jgi:hypothetical protein
VAKMRFYKNEFRLGLYIAFGSSRLVRKLPEGSGCSRDGSREPPRTSCKSGPLSEGILSKKVARKSTQSYPEFVQKTGSDYDPKHEPKMVTEPREIWEPFWGSFSCFWPRGPKMAPRGPLHGPKKAPRGDPRWFQEGQHGAQRTHDGSKMAPTRPQEGPRRPKMAPKGPQDGLKWLR